MCDYEYVNGPVNLVRLESDEKVLYMFMDVHEHPMKETECGAVSGVNFTRYLYERLKLVDKEHCVFLELSPVDAKIGGEKYKGKYIQRVINFFKKSFSMDGHLVFNSSEFPKSKLEIIDIRDCLFDMLSFELSVFLSSYFSSKKSVGGDLYKRIKSINLFLNYQILETIIEIHNMLYNEQYQLNRIYESELTQSDIENIFNLDKSKKYHVYKNTYSCKGMKKKIVNRLRSIENPDVKKYIEENLKGHFIESIDRYSKMIRLYEQDGDLKKMMKLQSEYANIYFLENVSSRMMDLYVISKIVRMDRRLGILYTGIGHTPFIIFLLIKFYNYRMTHASHVDGGVSRAVDLIKREDSYNHRIESLFMGREQCINITSFPKNFN